MKLREYILYAYICKDADIQKSVVNILKTRLQNVKDIWKLLIIPKLEQTLSKQADLLTPSPFLIEISLTYANDEIIFDGL